jgi:D-glycero-alpha-D-manno-heptose-7-phosphate kinase
MAQVSNDLIDNILSIAKSKGASTGKVCGAGGGGCMVILANDSNKIPSIKEAISKVEVVEILNFEADSVGLSIK